MNTSIYSLIFIISFSALLLFSANTNAMVIEASGNPADASSQLIYWFDRDEITNPSDPRLSVIQVTNTNDTEGVWIHVQIFRSYDADENLLTPGDKVFCDERNFIDFLTPNDTHPYIFNEDTFPKNDGETSGEPGQSTSIGLANTKGFVVITPVVSESDLTAISFEHMTGTVLVLDNDVRSYRVNAMGRKAVDFTTGEKLPDGTPLDGETNGFVLLQPQELVFNIAQSASESDVVVIAFTDEYGPPGLLGYGASAATVELTSFVFDYKESPTSCGNRILNCFIDAGLTDNITASNELLSDELLCEGVTLPAEPETGTILVGMGRIFVNEYDEFENILGIFAYREDEYGASRWMNSF